MERESANTEPLRAAQRSLGGLQTQHHVALAELRRAREGLGAVRDLADRLDSAISSGVDVLDVAAIINALRDASLQGESPRGPWPKPRDVVGCAFCDIMRRRARGAVVRRWPNAIALRPLKPVTEGHLLVIPVTHVEDLAADPVVTGSTAKHVAELAAELGGDLNVITSLGPAASQSVYHLHWHLVPRHLDDGLALPWHSGKLPNWHRRARQHRANGEPGVWLNRAEVARILNVNARYVDQLLASGELTRVTNEYGATGVLSTDLATWKEQDDEQRMAAAVELTRLAEEMGDTHTDCF